MDTSLTTRHAVPASPPRAPVAHPWLGLAGWGAVCLVAALVGALASQASAGFYLGLDRPAWAPPASVFGPVWTVLYAMMAVAAWQVWCTAGWSRAGGALALFVLQLLANALWTWLFFAWQRGGLAFADITVLWLLIGATIVAFWRVRRSAALLMLPYWAWVTFAAALSWSVWQRNPQVL